jgi:hypothetical protein
VNKLTLIYQVDFESSLILKGKFMQSVCKYDYDMGNMGSLAAFIKVEVPSSILEDIDESVPATSKL